jgi:hypothetical protein
MPNNLNPLTLSAAKVVSPTFHKHAPPLMISGQLIGEF